MVEKIKNKWNDIEKPSKIEWIILSLILIFCFISFNHADLMLTSSHGRGLLELILQGKFFEFYDVMNGSAVYLIPIYLFFAIWSIPLFIVYGIFNIPLWPTMEWGYVSGFVLLWYKLLPVLFCVATSFVLVKIAKKLELNETRIKWIPYLFLGSTIVIFSQFIFGQYDSINMFFTMLAIYFYLNKKYYKFSIIMSLAITLKMFPIFIFIPLILLVEKRIIHIVKYLAIGLSGTVICNLLFTTSEAFKIAKDFTTGMIDRFFVAGISTHFGTASFFLMIFIAVCVFAYIKKYKEEKELNHVSIYLSLLVYSGFYMFVLWHPQWVILLVPFLILTLMMNDNEKTTIILYIVIFLSYLCLVCTHFARNVDENLINSGMLVQIFNHGVPNEGMISNFINGFDFLNTNMYNTLFLGAMIINLVLKYPSEKRLKSIIKYAKETKFPVERGYLLVYVLTIFAYIIPTLYLFFKIGA